MQAIKNRSITIEHCPINILEAGDFNTAPLLFLHGKAFQAETWRELGTLDAAIQAGFSVVAIDLPGYGKTPEAELEPDEIILGIMQSLELSRIILVGPSMGGKLCLEFSIKHPKMVAGLVVIGAVGVKENRSRLQELPAKTLIIWGENDQISDPANGTLLNQEVVGSKLVVFKGAKHPCYLEQPQLWHDTLLNFAKTVSQ